MRVLMEKMRLFQHFINEFVKWLFPSMVKYCQEGYLKASPMASLCAKTVGRGLRNRFPLLVQLLKNSNCFLSIFMKNFKTGFQQYVW